MNANKALLVVLVLLLAVAGGFYLLHDDQAEPRPDAGPTPTTVEERPAAPVGPDKVSQAAAPERTQLTERRPVATTLGDGRSFPQGVRGKVLDPFGRPLADADVYLMRGVANNVFMAMTLASKGIVYPPLAQARTDRGGAFSLGVQQTGDGAFELRALHPRYVEHRMPSLQIVADQWHDLEPITLAQGAIVSGRVVIAGSGLPVPGAEVFLQSNTGVFDLSPVPGLERGLVAQVDATGNYRFECAPTGVCNIAAVAPQYARIEKSNVTDVDPAGTEVNFELPSGMAISGIVRNTDKAAIANARVTALALSGEQSTKGECRAGADGSFSIIGLLPGAYSVAAVAPGYIKSEVKPVDAGEASLQLELHRQGSVRLRVLGLGGSRVGSYRYAVKKPNPGQEQYGNTDVPPQSARPDANGVTTIDGLDPGSYAFEIEARGLARAFSNPFSIVAGGEAPLVEVQMDEGGVIEGFVSDAAGKPLAGVQVSTLPNSFQDIPLVHMFQGMVTDKVMRTATQSDAAGRYRLALLTPATYQLKFAHADSFDVSIRDQQVRTGMTTTVATVAMEKGTMITGTTRVGGKPVPQVKVTITSLASDTSQPVTQFFQCEAMSGADGGFTLPKRIPPGRYQVMAARQTLPNPLLMMSDYQKTKRELFVNRGQAQLVVDFQIPADNG